MPQNTGQGEVQPINKDHVTRCQTAVARDFVVVAGLDSDSEKVSVGNKARFVNQAIRMLILNKAKLRPGDRNVYLSFKGTPDKEDADGRRIRGHIGDQAHEELRTIVTRHGGVYMILDSADELVDFINSRCTEKKPIKKLDIFTHGYPNYFAFGYENSNKKIKERYSFGRNHAKRLKEEMFDAEAVITSWSCRTGISSYDEDLTGKDPGLDESLAQLIANTAQVDVVAFRRRSNYMNTYGMRVKDEGFFSKGLRSVRETPGELHDKWEERRVMWHDEAEEDYQAALDEYKEKEAARQARLEEYRKIEGNENAKSIPGDKPANKPVPPSKLDMTPEAIQAARNRSEERKIERRCDLPIKVNGALYPVIGADTPLGVPDGLFLYTPKLPADKPK